MAPHIRLMTPADIAAGMRLKDLAGWNQTADDWSRFLEFSPEGCFVAESDGQVAGTAATIIYEGGVAWIGMVLVDPDFRGRGYGTALLQRAFVYLEDKRVPCVKLDATPQGRPLYERLGFKLEYDIERCALRRTPGPVVPTPETSRDLAAVWELDREVFGADRTALLRSVAATAPELVVLARGGGSLEGYALGRRGSHADHLGPWVVRNEAASRDLLEHFLGRTQRERVIVDVLDGNPWARTLVREYGFEPSRPLARMYRGQNHSPGRPEWVCASLGPEFG